MLRDQKLIAGIGNAYSDEVLHAAKMSPFRLRPACPGRRLEALHAMSGMLREVIGSVGRGRRDLKNEKKAGCGYTAGPAPLPRVRRHVREVSFADSALQYCATCQTGGKPLADRRMSRLLK